MVDDELSVRWAELRIGLAREPGAGARPAARELFGAVRAGLADWTGSGAVRWCWFMRKPPDVRLRLGGDHPERAVTDLAPVLERLVVARLLLGWTETIYEPETRKFGGSAAMEAVHAHFDADTRSWLELDPLVDGSPVDPGAVVTAAADDLLVRLLDDGGEVWDAWCNVVDLTAPTNEVHEPGRMGERYATARWSLESLGASLVPMLGERAVKALARYSSVNQALADRVGGAVGAGRLAIGPRALGALVIQYQAHRWGLDGTGTSILATEAAARWDPRRGLRGALLDPPGQ